MAIAEEWLNTESRKVLWKYKRGTDADILVETTYTAAEMDAATLRIRLAPDELLLYEDNAGDVGTNLQIGFTLAGTDTASWPGGTHVYEVEVELDGGGTEVVQEGNFVLYPNLSLPAREYPVPSNVYAGLMNADPAISAANPVLTEDSGSGLAADISDLEGTVTALQNSISNVNNTSDANKPVSTAQQAALDALLAKVVIPNLAFDPFNRYYAPTTDSQDGRDRWYDPANLARITPDTSNPYGTPTIRFSGSATGRGGRALYLTEMGIKAGDKMSFGIYCLLPSTRVARLAIAWRDASESVLSTVTGASTPGADSSVWLSINNQTVPANAVQVDMYILGVSGSGAIDIYEWRAVRGASALVDTADTLAGVRAWNAVQGALGGFASLGARLTDMTADISAFETGAWSGEEVAFGRHLLRDWQAALAGVQLAVADAQAVVVMLGDSWVNTDKRLAHAMRTRLQALYGNAGIGFVSAATDHVVPTSVTRTISAGWTQRTKDSTPKGLGVDLFHMVSSDTSTPASILWSFTAVNAFKLYYLEQAGGGEFEWRVDSGSWTAVDTDAAEALGTVEVTGLDGGMHALEVRVTAAGSAGVTLFGVEIQRTGNGVRVHKVGATGSTAGSWVNHPNPTLWAAQIAELAPNLITITLGTNDDSGDVAAATFRANLETMISRIRAVLPLVDILLITPSDNDQSPGSVTIADYVSQIRALCVEDGYAGFDAYLLLGDYDDADTRGLYADANHINEKGGNVIVRQVIKTLLETA